MSTRNFAASTATVLIFSAGLLVSAPPPADPADPKVPDLRPVPEPVEVKDVFSVSRVGQPNAKEGREVLLAIFEEVAKRHSVDAATKKGEVMAKAETFRILERASGPESEGENLCLCEHGGGYSIVSFPSGAFPRGETTPPMAAEKLGLKPYRVKVKRPHVEGAPAPGENTGSVAAFFGALGVGVKPGFEVEIEPFSPESPPPAVDPGPVESTEFGRKFETFTADLALPKWTADLAPVGGSADELTREEFVQGLRDGKTYEYKTEELRKCPMCLGFGRIADDRKDGREKDGKRECPKCFSQTKLLHKVTYEVRW